MRKLIHEGSVKDIYQETENEIIFRFSDRYSIFDWGKMPDDIPGKGEALAEMGATLLEEIQKLGVPTHFMRRGKDKREFAVKAVHVPRGNLSVYGNQPKNILIPIEFIYRFGVPRGSSLLKKYTSEVDWIKAGFDRRYQEGEFFNEMAIDFTTKLEPLDRELKKDEMLQLSGLTDVEFEAVVELIRKTANYLDQRFKKAGLVLWDGKLELALDENRKPMLVDSIGLDEMRLTFEKKPLSKEVLRQFYIDSDWYRALLAAKREAPEQFRKHCQQVLKQAPKQLPEKAIHGVSSLYQSVSRLLRAKNENEIKAIHDSIRTAFQILEVKS